MDPTTPSDRTAELPSRQSFTNEVGRTFRASIETTDVGEFVLSEVMSNVSNDRQENFTLLFRSAADGPLIQGIYNLDNDRLGKMEIFLVPVRKGDEGLYLEAVFNHLKPGGGE